LLYKAILLFTFLFNKMASAAESKENVEMVGNEQSYKPGQKNPTPAPGNGGFERSQLT
jgi:hypothetical protein